MKTLLSISLLCLSLLSFGQSKEGFSLEMFGQATAAINAFGSNYEYTAVADWTEMPFEAGAGVAFRQNAGSNAQWGFRFTVSRLAFAYSETDFTDNNGDIQVTRPVSTRRIYMNFNPIYSFRVIEASSFDLDLENSLGLKLPVNAYSLGRDAGGNNVDINDLQNSGIGSLTVFQLQVAPTFVWGAARLGIPFSYNFSSGDNWEFLSGWSAGLSLSYFIEE